MRNRIKDNEVRRRIPKGYEMPEEFDHFLFADPPFDIEWNDLHWYDLQKTALDEVVPFLHLPDGGRVALWYYAKSPAVVHIGGHGELEVLAIDFNNFLRGINSRCSGLPDFDEMIYKGKIFQVPFIDGEPNREALPALQEKFDDWFKKHTSLLKPLEGTEAEELRKRVFHIGEEMIRDGLTKVYSDWWSIDFRIERHHKCLLVTFRDSGVWQPVPDKYQLCDEITILLKLVKNTKRRHYELSVCSAGIVSIDRDHELVLVPPKEKLHSQ